MHVPIEHHRRVVDILLAVFFVLLILLAMLIKQKGEETIVIEPKNEKEETAAVPAKKALFEYIEVVDGCGPHFEGGCLNVRSGPGSDYPSVMKLRNGVVLKVDEKVEQNGEIWYKIVFDEKIKYPERITTDWYVSADYVRLFLDEGVHNAKDPENNSSGKRIIIDRSEQMLYAYGSDGLFMKVPISTGLESTPTPRGLFTIFKKTPSRYMQGPIPAVSDQFFDLPGVPWNLYFTYQGAAIHGTYWHKNFGKQSSHGCVNLTTADAQKLYNWAGIGTFVIVQD